MNNENCCCPKFNPAPWDEKEITWENKKFAQDHVVSFLHIPLNFGSVLKRISKKMEASNIKSEDMIVMSNDGSLWGMNIFVDAPEDIKDCQMKTLSGTFLTKVFEGPYRDMGKWIKEMQEYVQSKGKEIKRQYYYYTTCPKCAKKYGENYTVILAQTN